MDIRLHSDTTLDSIFTRPRMWGGPEAIELQVLLLLEVKALLGGAEDPHEAVMARYRDFLGEIGDGSAHLLSGQTSDIDRLVAHLADFRAREEATRPSSGAELQAAIHAAKAAEERVFELRSALVKADEPRKWRLSHERVYQFEREYPGTYGFAECTATRAEIEGRLREEISRLAFDRTRSPLDVQARASCALTGETLETYVWIEQTVPECTEGDSHRWLVMGDHASSPRGRKLVEGCPKCNCRRDTEWPDASKPEAAKVAYDADHYPDGDVQRMHVRP
jgi:hypothetical protein